MNHATRLAFMITRSTAILSILLLQYISCTKHVSCAQAVEANMGRTALDICRAELTDSHEPDTLILTAKLLADGDDHDREEAWRYAQQAYWKGAKGDALQVMGQLEADREDFKRAELLLEKAHDAHEALPRHAALARDAEILATVYGRTHNYTKALLQLDECRAEASLSGDRELQGYCEMAIAQTLEETGYFEAAQQELQHAETLLRGDTALVYLETERASLYQDWSETPSPKYGDTNRTAITSLIAVKERALRIPLPESVVWADLNLAASYARLDQFADAEAALQEATLFDVDNEDTYVRMMVEAAIAERRGDPETARALDTEAYSHISNAPAFELQIATREARIALAAGDDLGVEIWAGRGIGLAEEARAQNAVELRPWVLSADRTPYELLFVLRVRQHRFADAIEMFDHWQGRALLDELHRGRTSITDYQAATEDISNRVHTLARLTASPIAAPVDRATLLARLGRVDLVAVVVADRDVYRITANHGAFDIVDLGHWDALKDDIAAFVDRPTSDSARAERLGALLLGPGAFRPTRESLLFMLDGPEPLARVPESALMHDGRFLINSRAVVRPSRMTEVQCTPPPDRSIRAVIVADAGGDLPEMRDEARVLAASLPGRAFLGPEATSAALLATPAGGILHVGTHAKMYDFGVALTLADSAVFGADIAADSYGRAFVFLASCISGIAADEELSTSLASAYLASGTHTVVATLALVDEREATPLVNAFYQGGGPSDPARVLARAQAELATKSNKDWMRFAVFGHDTCRKESP